MNTIQNSTTSGAYSNKLGIKIPLAILVVIIGLTTVNFFANETQHWGINENINHLLRGAFFSVIVITGIWLIRRKFQASDISIGYRNPIIAVKTMALGLGLILVPLVITLVATHAIGWASVQVNTSAPFIGAFLIGFCATFLTDALTEEVVFRGFIYAHLNTRFNKLKSSIISVALFATFPVVIVALQKLMNYPVFIGGADHITPSFMVTMVFFGSFMQYLRVLTNSVWTSIGFHTLFVFMNMLIGTSEGNLIQLSSMSNESATQILLISLVVLVFASLIAYPYAAKKPIGWKEVA